MMNKFEIQAAQGDVWFRKIARIPASAHKQERRREPLIVAHSETGHHHSFPKDADVTYYTDAFNSRIAYLSVASSAVLSHHREEHTHGAYVFEPGCYELRRPREYVSRDEDREVVD